MSELSHTPPVSDPQHLATLYQITRELNSSLDLDTVLENVMDRVIEVTNAERGFLMLCDNNRGEMEFKVARGMDRRDLQSPEFQVSTTIIRKVMQTRQPLLTDNAQFDKRFTRGESIMILGLRSILCVPILVKERLIGLVYVDNRLQAGLFNESHRELLTAFAAQAGVAIENARLYRVAVEKGRMEKELQMAQVIQRDLLPGTLPVLAGYDITAEWRTAREVAGDFYDCLPVDDGLGVIIADVSDKGAPAAIFMAMARSLIRSATLMTGTPEAALRQTNATLLQDIESGMFVTVYYALLHPGGRVLGVNAGHNRPLLWRTTQGTHEFLPRGGRPLGWFADLPLRPVEFQMTAGDVLILYTDGLTEAENERGEPFGDARLVETVRACADRPASAIKEHLIAAVEAFRGAAPPFDDTTLVVVRYAGQ